MQIFEREKGFFLNNPHKIAEKKQRNVTSGMRCRVMDKRETGIEGFMRLWEPYYVSP